MNSKRLRHFGLLSIVFAVLLVFLLLKIILPNLREVGTANFQDAHNIAPKTQSIRSDITPLPEGGNLSGKTRQEKQRQVIDGVIASLNMPIEFYGVVIDQNNNPVPEAEVHYSALDKFDAPGSAYQGRSDASGVFSIKGVRGAVLNVGVRKKGYYPIGEKSTGMFAYGIGADEVRRKPPTQNAPAIFVLHKIGQTESLVHFDQYYKISRTGEPVEVNLETGKLTDRGDLRVQAWTDDLHSGKKVRYDWKCLLSVPGGGLLERVNEFAFEAPVGGYNESVEIAMQHNTARWSPQGQWSYFVKLADGRYARVEFKMIAGGEHYFRLESYYNPIPGSRNLEYNPEKAIKP